MIRWPQDALIFSARVRDCGVYAAGYVEGDTAAQEILGARRTETHGLELVALRGMHDSGAFGELRAIRALSSSDGVAPVLDAFIAFGPLQPLSVSSLGASARTVIVAESLPADVHLADLSRALFRRSNGEARPPAGLALYVVREVARIYAASKAFRLVDDDSGRTFLHLTRRAANILLGWDGTVHIQPRVTVGRSPPPAVTVGLMPDEDDVERTGAVAACGHHLLRLLASDIPDIPIGILDRESRSALIERSASSLSAHVTPALARLARAATGVHDTLESLSLDDLIARFDELLADEPFSRADLAGTLAQLFADERAQDLAFREELSACDLDALALAEVRAVDVDGDVFAMSHDRR